MRYTDREAGDNSIDGARAAVVVEVAIGRDIVEVRGAGDAGRTLPFPRSASPICSGFATEVLYALHFSTKPVKNHIIPSNTITFCILKISKRQKVYTPRHLESFIRGVFEIGELLDEFPRHSSLYSVQNSVDFAQIAFCATQCPLERREWPVKKTLFHGALDTSLHRI